MSTGHSANIFSVKFMPHSNDRTLVTAAGDAEVRVFDIEYNGRSTEASRGSNIASTGRGQRFQNMYRGVRYLSDGTTNARVYRSHADRVKRIVTESSPNLFLTCSEDGEVYFSYQCGGHDAKAYHRSANLIFGYHPLHIRLLGVVEAFLLIEQIMILRTCLHP